MGLHSVSHNREFTSDCFASTAAWYFISSFSRNAVVFYSLSIISVNFDFISCSSNGIVNSLSFVILSTDVSLFNRAVCS